MCLREFPPLFHLALGVAVSASSPVLYPPCSQPTLCRCGVSVSPAVAGVTLLSGPSWAWLSLF